MLQFIAQHQFVITAAIFWILSAAVSALPKPAPTGSPAYRWLYRFSHTIAGNLTTAFRLAARYRAILWISALLLLLPVSTSACSVHYRIHPGALNATDSAAYDALLIGEAVIDQARLDFQAGRLPAKSEPALDALIRSYNTARASWLFYRGALAASGSSDGYFDPLTKSLSDLTDAIRKFEEASR